MSTTLKIVDSSALSETEWAELDANIDSLIAAHKNNRQEINRLVFESVAAMTIGEDYERQLANKKGLRRFLGAITGSNKRLQDKINNSRAAAQYASQQTLQRLAEQNLMSFDLVAAVNNKLNASILSVEGEINHIYKGLLLTYRKMGDIQEKSSQMNEDIERARKDIGRIQQTISLFLKKNLSDMLHLENRIDQLERNVNLIQWQASIEYQMFGDVAYVDLNDIEKVVCLTRDFFDITQGAWTSKDLLILKAAIGDIGLMPKTRISYLEFIRTVHNNRNLQEKLLNGQCITGVPAPDYLPVFSGLKKMDLLEAEENNMVVTSMGLLSSYNVTVDTSQIVDDLTTCFLAQEGMFNSYANVCSFDLVLELLFSLRKAQEDGLLVENLTDTVGIEKAEELYMQGQKFEDGDGVAQNWEEAVHYYQIAADLGHAGAQVCLGNCYDNGDGVKMDKVKAAEWYARAAEQGDAFGQYNLAVCYEEGEGVSKDVNKATELYQGAVSGFQMTANYGDVEAQDMLGDCYMYGDGIVMDKEKAVEWYAKAAAKGYAPAERNLGCCYEFGDGVTKSAEEAVKWYKRAANHGDRWGQLYLGLCYKGGFGVPKDVFKAVSLYREAAKRGCSWAEWALGDCYEYGGGVSKNMEEAAKWYKKAADRGDADAQYALGKCYMDGKGVPKNMIKAIELFLVAAKQGQEEAQTRLENCSLEQEI